MGGIWGKGSGWSPGRGQAAQPQEAQIGWNDDLGGEVLQAQQPAHTQVIKKQNPPFFYWSVLVGICYKTGPVGLWNVRGGVHSIRCQHWGQCSRALWQAVFTPQEGNRAAQTVAQWEETPEALLLSNGKGLLHLDLATVCDDHIFQRLVPAVRLGALHLPHHLLGKAEAGK